MSHFDRSLRDRARKVGTAAVAALRAAGILGLWALHSIAHAPGSLLGLLERVAAASARDWVRSLVFALTVMLLVLPPGLRAFYAHTIAGFTAWEVHCAPGQTPAWSDAWLCALWRSPSAGPVFREAVRLLFPALPSILVAYLLYKFALGFSGWSVRTARALPGLRRRARAARTGEGR